MGEETSDLKIDWRVAPGLTLTLIWISCGFLYLSLVVGLDQFVHLPTADIGSFLEGAFAPLAFLWLVVGHFMQQKEISANTRAIKIQEQSARRLEIHSQRDSYFKLLSLVQGQLGAIATSHYILVCGTGESPPEQFMESRSLADTGDPALFIRKMISLAIQHRNDSEALKDVFFGSDTRTRHSDTFVDTFGKLLAAAHPVDTDNMVMNALLNGSPAGVLYRIIRHVKGDEGLESLLGTASDNPETGG